MKRAISLLLCMVLLCGMLSISASAEGDLNLVLSNQTAKAGEEVEVLLSVENNPGLTGISAEVTYDESVLTLTSCTPKTGIGVWSDTIAEDHLVYWYCTPPEVFNGTEVVALQFKVAENAPEGTYAVNLSFGPWDGIGDVNGDAIDFKVIPGSVTVKGDEPEPAGATLEIYGTSISLNGAIGLNVYVKPTEEQIADEGFTVKLNEQAFQFKDNYKSSDGLYRFPVSLRAKQMTDPVTVTAVDGEGNAVKLLRASVGKPEDSCDFSIADYVEKTVKTGTPEKLVALVKAMSRYGNLAQVALSYNTANLAPMYDQDALDTVTLDKVSAYQATATAGEASGVKYAGCSVVLDSETDLGIYLEADAGSKLADFTYTVNGKKASLVETSQGTCVKVANISAKNLDRENTIVVTNGEGKTVLTVKASAMSYVYGALNSSTLEAKYVNAAKALFLYCEAANTYWG